MVKGGGIFLRLSFDRTDDNRYESEVRGENDWNLHSSKRSYSCNISKFTIY